MLFGLRKIIISLCLCSFGVLSAQKVGLVLSGGGAAGISHIGVMKALEEHNIPIDYVCGNSMGGIIGAFYAAGFSPDSIEKIFTSEEVNNALTGRFNNKYNFYYSKKDDNPSWLQLGVKLDSSFNVSFRPSLFKDYNLNFALLEYLSDASHAANYDFDSLYVPYRAIASDIFTQKEVILRRGALNDAARVTGSVPLIYRPIKYNGKFLFDGGIYNNFPVDVMQQEFAPDIIIGVNVSSVNFSDYPYENDDELIDNYLVYMFVDNSDSTALKEGVYLEPDVRKYGATDFRRLQAIIDSGYAETIRSIEEIKQKIAERVSAEEREKARLRFLEKKKTLRFGELSFDGYYGNQKKFLRRLFSKYDSLDLPSVKKNYSRLVAEEYFQDVYATVIYNRKKDRYAFVLRGKAQKNVSLMVGGNIASRNISNIHLGIDFTYLGKLLNNYHIDVNSGSFYRSIYAKARLQFPTKPSIYLEPKLVYNSWDYVNTNNFLSIDDEKTILKRFDTKLGLEAGVPSGIRSKLTLGAYYIENRDQLSNRNNLAVGDTLDRLNLYGGKFNFLYSRNSLNRKLYASEGSALSFGVNYYDVRADYNPGNTSSITENKSEIYRWLRADFHYEQYLKANWFHYGYQIDAVVSTQRSLYNYRTTQLYAPSFYPLQDSKTFFLPDFRANQYVAGGLKAVVSTKSNIDIRAEAYLFKPIKKIVEGDDQSVNFEFENLAFSLAGTVGAVYHSPIGPLSVSLNYYETDDIQLGVLIHFGYLLFNKRSEE